MTAPPLAPAPASLDEDVSEFLGKGNLEIITSDRVDASLIRT
jgi:hypothetical protein